MKKKQKKELVTNEDLARLIDGLATATANGFAGVQKSADDRFKLIIDRFERVEADVGDIKRTLGPIVQMMAVSDREVDNIKLRLNRVERKVGIKN